jgi:hypothetical protein
LDTHGPELGNKATACTGILNGGIVNNALEGSAGFFFDGRFIAITEPGFCPVFSFFFCERTKNRLCHWSEKQAFYKRQRL